MRQVRTEFLRENLKDELKNVNKLNSSTQEKLDKLCSKLYDKAFSFENDGDEDWEETDDDDDDDDDNPRAGSQRVNENLIKIPYTLLSKRGSAYD